MPPWCALVTAVLLLQAPAPLAVASAVAQSELEATGHRAFFMVFSPMLTSPDWPTAYAKYSGGIAVMNPYNSSAAAVEKVRTDLNVKVLMYWDTEDIQIKADNGRCLSATRTKICNDSASDWTKCASGAMPCCFSYECDAYKTTTCPDDDFSAALRAIYPQSLAVNDLSAGRARVHTQRSAASGIPICIYGKGPLGCHSNRSNTVLVPFLADWVKSRTYDGIYFDQYFKLWSHSFAFHVDTDGDGQPDSASQSRAQYDTYRPLFASQLRAALGPGAVMIANSGLGQVDPSLNG